MRVKSILLGVVTLSLVSTGNPLPTTDPQRNVFLAFGDELTLLYSLTGKARFGDGHCKSDLALRLAQLRVFRILSVGLTAEPSRKVDQGIYLFLANRGPGSPFERSVASVPPRRPGEAVRDRPQLWFSRQAYTRRP